MSTNKFYTGKNENGKRVYGYTTYLDAINYIKSNRIELWCVLGELDPDYYYKYSKNKETGAECDLSVFQEFLTDFSDEDCQFLVKRFSDLHFAYAPNIDKNVLMVTHYGSPWNGVAVEIFDKDTAERLDKEGRWWNTANEAEIHG